MINDIETQADQIVMSVCWSCMKSTWACMCEWPQQRPAGIKTIDIFGVDHTGDKLERVIFCPARWPETKAS